MANNIFHGVPWDHSSSVSFDADPTISYFFRMNNTTNLNEVFIHDELSNTTTVSDIGIPTMFPDLPTHLEIIHGSENQPSNIGEHLIYWMDNALSPPLQFIVVTSETNPAIYIGSTNPNNVYHTGTAVEQVSTGTQWYVVFGWDFFYAARGSISHLLYTGNYGAAGQPYAGLPYTGGGAAVETNYCSILRVTGQDDQVYLFTPTGDAIILDLLAQQISSTVPYGPIVSAPTANYIGMNYNLDCVCFDAWDETTIMAFKADVIQFFTNEVLTSTQSRLAMFPQIGTNTISSVYRASQAGTNPNTFWQLYFYDTAGNYWRYEASSLNPTGYTFLNSGTHPWMVNTAPRGEGWQLWFKNDNGVMKVDAVGNTGNYQPYGPGNTLYPTLPNTQVPDACWHNTASGIVYVSIIDTIYLLDTATATVTSFAKYNVTPPTTPLPDIVIPYSAPSQFNLFASDISKVSQSADGWRFIKTINDSSKMELYIYHSAHPAAIPFIYSDLIDLKVTMKNSLIMPSGNIFWNIYTVGTAGGWYGTKTTYMGTPPLGTTLDTGLVETIISISDTRTDQILAISIGSNSAKHQVHVDVNKASFNILIPSINSTQRVEVQLQTAFILNDNKYWNFDQILNGYTDAVLKTGWMLYNFVPRIVAGVFPQTISCREQPGGTAFYLSGTFQYWETTDGVTWTASAGKTLTFDNTAGSTGKQSNGWAYMGCNGTIGNFGTGWPALSTGLPVPVLWEITNTNMVRMVWSGHPVTNSLSLNLLPSPNNFTLTQFQSGMFDSSAASGGVNVGVFIGSSVSPAQQPTSDETTIITAIDYTVIDIKRSWELNTTRYVLNPANPLELLGQYVDPTNLPSLAPNNYKGSSDLIVLAENNTEFEILFSGGLNNRIPADVSGTYTMTVTPTPANTALTFAWTANYYTAGDVLISAVAGIGTTGLVSSFTVGGASLPVNCGYVLYGCTSSENIDAYASLVIIQPPTVPVVPFILTFQAPNNQISTDGIYSVFPVVANPLHSYVYTATFRDITSTSLGPVVGAGLSGQSSSFNITYSNLPATVAYIDYTCTDGTESSQLSITIVPICPPCPPIPDPDDIYGNVISESSANIIQSNNSVDASHKRIDVKKLDNITLELTDIDGNIKYCSSNIYYELEFKINKSLSF